MSDTQTTTPAAAPTAAPPPEPAARPPQPAPKPAPPARELPEIEAIAGWVEGAELPELAALFELPTGATLPLAKFDALGMQIRKEELLPQHWQPLSDHTPPADSAFDGLAVVARLRAAYGDPEAAERRLAQLRLAWRELAGKQPSLWSVPDVLAAMRRLIEREIDFEPYELLCAVRDVWRGMTLPFGREQLEILWACLAFIRDKTRK
ncbi:MAG: hypothetical protein OES32_15295 [Acidobacteriota bacterium]|nr:hypothetical protein [Acidobacteriota bacterium]MDH3524947.1 hypothetical protein [Acidobacteriota bacterium]